MESDSTLLSSAPAGAIFPDSVWTGDTIAAGLILLSVIFLHGFFVAAEVSLVRAASGQAGLGIKGRSDSIRSLDAVLIRLESALAVCRTGAVACLLISGASGLGLFGGLMHPLVLQIGVPPGVFATGLVAILGAGASLVLVAIFGDSIPRGIAYHHAGRVALWCLRPLGWFQSLLGPVATLLHGFTIGVLRIFSLQSEALPTEASLEAQGAEDLRIVFAQARRTGRIPEAKLVLLERMFGFSDTFVRQVMVPRVEVAYFDRRKALADNLDLAQRTAHSRYPLVDGSLDRVVGVVHMKDLFWTITDLGTAMSDQGPSASSRRHPAIAGGDILKNPPGSGADFLTGISRQVLFVPETMRLESLLREFQNRKVHMAMVVDEFGGVSGLVTFENVIEEIVGEVQDEFDMEQPLIRKLSDREWLLDGITPLDLANEALGLRLSSEEADTIGGFLSSELGRLPLTGESVNLDGVEFIIREVRRLRVQRVLARLPSPEVIGASEGP